MTALEKNIKNTAVQESVSQWEVPKMIVYGTLLIDGFSQGKELTEYDLELLYEIFGNPQMLEVCLQNYQTADSKELREVVKNNFDRGQKMKLMADLTDLLYKRAEPTEEELVYLNKMSVEIYFLLADLKRLIDIFMLKNYDDIFDY